MGAASETGASIGSATLSTALGNCVAASPLINDSPGNDCLRQASGRQQLLGGGRLNSGVVRQRIAVGGLHALECWSRQGIGRSCDTLRPVNLQQQHPGANLPWSEFVVRHAHRMGLLSQGFGFLNLTSIERARAVAISWSTRAF